ncbi:MULTISPECIES: hypothetical protein [unclassified Streptomyces]|uniref:hypothetical protein n=1 Tax=unclassified Streptomyces TaxID=2593676 RepID=UPI0036F8A379
MTDPTPEQLEAGTAHGLTPAQCRWIRGETPEEMAADVATLLAEFAPPAAPPAPAPLVGGPRGTDVGSGNGRGTLAAGAAAYRAKHGLDDEGRRPERRPMTNDGRNPFQTNGYEMER